MERVFPTPAPATWCSSAPCCSAPRCSISDTCSAYRGMPDFVTPASSQKAIVFWLAARCLVAVGLLIVATRPWQPMLRAHYRYGLLAGVPRLRRNGVLAATLRGIEPARAFHPGKRPHPVEDQCRIRACRALRALGPAVLQTGPDKAPLSMPATCLPPPGSPCCPKLCFTLYASVSDVFQFHRARLQGHFLRLHLPGRVRRQRASALRGPQPGLGQGKTVGGGAALLRPYPGHAR